ncbi:GNAT family protein [Gaetbulibacter sp. M240]|uniref:GNAT family N-acetyltransferase n=1 Tax=Gaetbulibacter sp. M240 TaxID=3126511 RepID=UPI00374F79F4
MNRPFRRSNMPMEKWFETVHLEGELVALIPLEEDHKEGLLKAASDGKLWELWFTSVPSETTIDTYIHTALAQKQKGLEYPFVVIEKSSGTIIGSTRFYNLQPEHKRLEIGYTWYAKKHQRTGVNTECKLLLLQFAFETLKCIAVQFMTDSHNERSRAAIARIGAKQDGILRHHRINTDGTYRDSVVFSITNHEWPEVKKSLELKRQKYSG